MEGHQGAAHVFASKEFEFWVLKRMVTVRWGSVSQRSSRRTLISEIIGFLEHSLQNVITNKMKEVTLNSPQGIFGVTLIVEVAFSVECTEMVVCDRKLMNTLPAFICFIPFDRYSSYTRNSFGSICDSSLQRLNRPFELRAPRINRLTNIIAVTAAGELRKYLRDKTVKGHSVAVPLTPYHRPGDREANALSCYYAPVLC
ncbi:uncharacterized protein DEA37_0002585 [Paragonimus westermani]|uniref:Uncharacterized protein n=1 Tax=Paragonimus westermani TaxID=34504 RepID=A0A5J4NZG2_9TREM|nr:uncharacterized protein DEA37_0002585 [Paragonimus westermani]